MSSSITHSVEETAELAASLANSAHKGDVIFLSGELGAGKTTFSAAFAHALGVKEEVLSPTFVLARNYESGKLPLNHIDAYRLLESNLDDKHIIAQLAAAELDEFLEDGVTIIEWGSSFAHMFKKRIEVDIAVLDETSRQFDITEVGEE
ncbi:MAG: tRNA (adenosine(37)-N6)-threonylcarbamoyltransferase complex ATPase subunit type 1 TsaE [Candidatus Ancillula sp.]|jgi:tRNA threonylcarbamoyladenosine biosynthesis protein TsaE|nr:tRNA (adenosine(37)-N6)-threonylcarbamoyltransferase complex ATPase subunit type 1 TsaE [Candidatus Ancillula sp.]